MKTRSFFAKALVAAFLLAAGAALAPHVNAPVVASGASPVVTAIAPDEILSNDPDDSTDRVEDVQINGTNFGTITSAFLTQSKSRLGPRIPINNVVTVTQNTAVGTITVATLTPNVPYYVFVVRNDGAISTTYPNFFGYDVTFTTTRSSTNPSPPPTSSVTLSTCRVRSTGAGKLVLQVNGIGFPVNGTVVLLNGQPCAKTKFPSKYITSDGRTTRLNCHGNLKSLLPATVTIRYPGGRLSENSLLCTL